MIIRTVKLTNFGIYHGEQTFDLSPLPTERFNRPLIIFRGKNGVGKSTLVNALRLCLHGSLALDSRVAQQEYDEYLVRLVHRNPDGEEQPTTACVEVYFDHVKLGKKAAYRIVRAWARQGQRVVKTLSIWVNDSPMEEAQIEQKELFLRELVPPGLLNLFFFDGEKIQTLAEESDHSHQLLAETVRSLLGLDVVEQLGKDLDLFMSRQRGHGQMMQWQQELEQVVTESNTLEAQLAETKQRMTESETQIAQVRSLIAVQEQKLSSSGGQFAIEREGRLAQQKRLESEIESLRHLVIELCSGLLPFAIAPKLLNAVAVRLKLEKEIDQEQIAADVIQRQLSQLESRLSSSEFWSIFGDQLDSSFQQKLLAQISAEVHTLTSFSSSSANEMILHVSDRERRSLLNWIEQALTKIPQQFSEILHTLTARQGELARIKELLAQTPTLESIQPLLSQLTQFYQQLGALEQEQKEIQEVYRRLLYRIEQVIQQRRRIHEQIATQQHESSRLFLANKTQKVLELYRERVTARKIAQVETLLTNRFNQLCRKKGFLQRVQIDPHTFAVTLFRLGKEFSRQQLSAGENQLFAIATLWALREISGRPMPVIVDTPLSRLDSEHRISMMQEFFPFVSQQTLVLGTDIELDEDLYTYLQPAISHSYELSYYPAKGSTVVKHTTPPADVDQTELTAQLALL